MSLKQSKEEILQRIDNVLNDVHKELKVQERVIRQANPIPLKIPIGYHHLNKSQISQLSTRLLSTIFSLAPTESAYRDAADDVRIDGLHKPDSVAKLVGILNGLRADYEGGFLNNINEIIDAELFSDILDQAEYLYSENYVRAAFVVAGVALEGHLRRLAIAHGIKVIVDGRYVKAESINQDLVKVAVYDKTYQKSITSWLGLRHDAAHPDSKELAGELFEPMIMGVRTFIQRFPA